MDLYGLIGEKLGHSFSPKIHEIIFKTLKLNGQYSLYEIKKHSINSFPMAMRTLNIKGVNITIPYKKSLLDKLDFIDENAKKIGAINTISNSNGILSGYNTDYFGILKTFDKMKFKAKNSTALILGNGGAAKAVYYALINSGAKEISFVTRNNDNNYKYSDLYTIKKDIIINATSVGMHPDTLNSLVDNDIMSNFKYAFDLIYNPKETLFIKYGKNMGLTSENGLYMLVSQAIKSQEIWNNVKVSIKDYERIYTEIEKFYY